MIWYLLSSEAGLSTRGGGVELHLDLSEPSRRLGRLLGASGVLLTAGPRGLRGGALLGECRLSGRLRALSSLLSLARAAASRPTSSVASRRATRTPRRRRLVLTRGRRARRISHDALVAAPFNAAYLDSHAAALFADASHACCEDHSSLILASHAAVRPLARWAPPV